MNLRIFLTAGAAALTASIALAVGPAQAADAALLTAVAHCGTLNDPVKRLACYDALAPRVQAALSASPASPALVAAAPAPAPNVPAKASPTEEEQKSWFGFNMGDLFGTAPDKQPTPQKFGADKLPKQEQTKAAPEAPQSIDSITAKVTDYAYNAFGKFFVFLDNGQVWKQLQGDADRAHFRSRAGDNTVTISRGFLGSYNLTMNGSNHLYKVTRIK